MSSSTLSDSIADQAQIHIFPEGRVNQPKLNPRGGMFRWKWGVGRILMDSKVMPEVIPMWISGEFIPAPERLC